jgi:hypothetical protein
MIYGLHWTMVFYSNAVTKAIKNFTGLKLSESWHRLEM